MNIGRPLTGTDTFWNIAIPFRTSDRATSWGVDTMIAPVGLEDEIRKQIES